jgi:hypothetical protein
MVLGHVVCRLRAGARADLLEIAQVTYVTSHMGTHTLEKWCEERKGICAC